jgi:hypothetical protein
VLDSWEAGRVDPGGEDLEDFLFSIYRIGWHLGHATKSAPPPLWVLGAAARRSPETAEIERLLLEGKKSGGQIARMTGVSKSTIVRTARRLRKGGRLKVGKGQSRSTPKSAGRKVST